VLVGVVAQKGGNVLKLGQDLKRAAAEYEAALPAGFTIHQIADQAAVVSQGSLHNLFETAR
jgi:multidrug efflux pump